MCRSARAMQKVCTRRSEWAEVSIPCGRSRLKSKIHPGKQAQTARVIQWANRKAVHCEAGHENDRRCGGYRTGPWSVPLLGGQRDARCRMRSLREIDAIRCPDDAKADRSTWASHKTNDYIGIVLSEPPSPTTRVDGSRNDGGHTWRTEATAYRESDRVSSSVRVLASVMGVDGTGLGVFVMTGEGLAAPA